MDRTALEYRRRIARGYRLHSQSIFSLMRRPLFTAPGCRTFAKLERDTGLPRLAGRHQRRLATLTTEGADRGKDPGKPNWLPSQSAHGIFPRARLRQPAERQVSS